MIVKFVDSVAGTAVYINPAHVVTLRPDRPTLTISAPRFSSNCMVYEYVECLYLPAAAAFRRRCAAGGQLARALSAWQRTLETHWYEVRFGNLDVHQAGDQWVFRVQVYLGEVPTQWVQVELYADPLADEEPLRLVMRQGEQIPGARNGYVYQTTVPASRPAWHFTPRLIPDHPEVRVPAEAAYIVWQH
jgi:glycogen phosphorylase